MTPWIIQYIRNPAIKFRWTRIASIGYYDVEVFEDNSDKNPRAPYLSVQITSTTNSEYVIIDKDLFFEGTNPVYININELVDSMIVHFTEEFTTKLYDMGYKDTAWLSDTIWEVVNVELSNGNLTANAAYKREEFPQ